MANNTPITVEDLSVRLKKVAYKRYLDREDRRMKKRQTRPRILDVFDAFDYVNRCFLIGIKELPLNEYEYFMSDKELLDYEENYRACILYDLSEIPFDMVRQRLRREGVSFVKV